MPHSLRAKLSGLRYKGILEDKDYKRLCKALDNENMLEQIRNEIQALDDKLCQQFLIEDIDREVHRTYRECIGIIDKYR